MNGNRWTLFMRVLASPLKARIACKEIASEIRRCRFIKNCRQLACARSNKKRKTRSNKLPNLFLDHEFEIKVAPYGFYKNFLTYDK